MTPFDYRLMAFVIALSYLMACRPYIMEYRLKNWRVHHVFDLRRIAELERQVITLQFQVEYLRTAPIKTEKIAYGANGHYNNQLRFEVLEQKPKHIVVPFDVVRDSVRYCYNQIWKPEDWQNVQKENVWIERRENKNGKTVYRKMWIKPENFNNKTDIDLTVYSPLLDEEYVESELPCEWQYLGSETL